jgi:hypothetical protein
MKQKKMDAFRSFPANKSEFMDGYNKVKLEKLEFLFAALIPRQPNGSIDWIKWYQWEWNNPLTVDKAKKYIKEKVNPSLQSWFESLGEPSPNPTIRLGQINRQIDEYLNISANAESLVKIIEKQTEKGYRQCSYINPIYEDAQGKEIKIDTELITKFE